MTVGVLSPGSGPVRQLWITYHGADPTWAKRLPKTAILAAEGFAWGKGLYRTPTPIGQAAAELEAKLGCKIRGIGVAGFSEGCQAVRAQFLNGPDAAVCIDGAHASNNPLGPQVAPWTAYARRALEGSRVFVLTHTAIDTYGKYRTTAAVAAELEAQLGAELAADPVLPDGRGRVAGNFLLGAYPGKDAAAHIDQAKRVMPAALEWAAARMGSSAGASSSPGGDGAALVALVAAALYLSS